MKKVLIVLGIFVAVILFSILGFVCQWTGEAADVLYEETSPRALLKKYEYFKDMAAECDAKLATLAAFQDARETTIETYGEPKEWPKDVRQEYALSKSEILGIKASYN